MDVEGKTITIGTSKNGQAQTLPIAGPHLKRTAARELRRQVDEQTCMAVMGQKTPAIFQRYRIIDVEDKAAALKTLKAFA